LIVNVCPAAATSAPADRVWRVLTTPERFGEWLDATFVSASPPGLASAGQRVEMTSRALGRRWPVAIEVVEMDPRSRWLELRVRLPFGVVNEERVTLTETEAGGTLVRFN
jgi:hypothetical protein